MWWQMIVVTWSVNITDMSSYIVMPNMKIFILLKKYKKKVQLWFMTDDLIECSSRWYDELIKHVTYFI